MSRPDDDLSAVYRARTASGAARSRCPEPKAIVRVASGAADARERAEIARHVADCSDCALELQSVRRAAGAASQPRARNGALRNPAIWMAVAALLLLALLPVVLWRGGGPPDDVLRGDRVLDVRPPPDAELSTPPRELAWPAEPGASGYRVRLFDARAEPLWESEPTEAPRVELPEEVVRALSGGSGGNAFVWSVDVDGNVPRNRLGPFWFRVVGGGAPR